MKTVMIGDRCFKLPFVDLIPFDAEQLAHLRHSIKEDGRVHVPIICWKEKKDVVIDGSHRVIFSAELGLKPPPITYHSFSSEEEARDFCEKINHERRHLSQEQLMKNRQERLKRIAEARASGKSERQIAEEEGVSKTQVHDDLEEINSTGHPRPVHDVKQVDKVVGKDGKVRSARTKKLCDRCQRVGEMTNCKACADLRAKGGKRKKGDAHEPKKPVKDTDALHDNYGTEIPKKFRDAWADPWIQETYDFLCEMSETFRMERLVEGMMKRARYYPFFNATDFKDGCGFIMQYFDALISHLKDQRPDAVCPNCNGLACDKCRGRGLVPKNVYKEMKKR